MELKNLRELLKRVKLPLSSKEIGIFLEEYLSSRGLRGSFEVSSLRAGKLYLKTNSSAKYYLHTHKPEVLALLQKKFPEANFKDFV